MQLENDCIARGGKKLLRHIEEPRTLTPFPIVAGWDEGDLYIAREQRKIILFPYDFG